MNLQECRQRLDDMIAEIKDEDLVGMYLKFEIMANNEDSTHDEVMQYELISSRILLAMDSRLPSEDVRMALEIAEMMVDELQ